MRRYDQSTSVWERFGWHPSSYHSLKTAILFAYQPVLQPRLRESCFPRVVCQCAISMPNSDIYMSAKNKRTCKMYASKHVSTLLAWALARLPGIDIQNFQLISSILCHGRLYYLKIQIWNYYIVHSSCTCKVYTVMLSFDPWKINWCRHHLVRLRTICALAAHCKISSGVNKNIAVTEYRF